MLGAGVAVYAISGFIVACTCLSIAASIDVYKSVFVCKLGLSLYSPICMLLGGLLFLFASILYLPLLSKTSVFNAAFPDLGVWLFRLGSLAYLAGNYRLVSHWFITLKQNGFCHSKDVSVAVGILVFMLG